MKIILVRSVLLFAAVYCFIAANYNNTNSNLLGDNNSVPPNVAKYVTPFGTGDHSGSSWNNAYSFKDMQGKLASNTSYNLVDSTFLVDVLEVNGFTNISFIGQGKDKTILEGIDVSDVENISEWSLWCFDILNSPNVSVNNLQIRRFRRWGIRVGSTSSNFLGYNLYVDSCGWTAQSGEVMLSPCAVKLFGDNGHIGQSQIMESGWDGMQVAGYYVLVDSSTIYWTGKDDPGAIHQGDGIHLFHNPDITYMVNNIPIKKSGRLIVKDCTINTVEEKKSGIEAGYLGADVEKPMVQVYDSYIAGGKAIDVTQDANPLNGAFYSYFENCRLESFRTDRPTFRIEYADAMPFSWIKNNTFYSPADYHPIGINCPVAEYDTDSTAVLYVNNQWRVGSVDSTFCVTHNLVTP